MEELTRLTPATVDVLRVLQSADDTCWGLRVIKQSGRPAGSVYPILDRLETAGWVTSEWEQDDTRSGPRRRFYEMTEDGATAAAAAIARFDAKTPPAKLRLAGAKLRLAGAQS